MSKKTEITILKRYEFKTYNYGVLEDPTYTDFITYFNGESIVEVFECELCNGEIVVYRWDMTKGIVEEMGRHFDFPSINQSDLTDIEELHTGIKKYKGFNRWEVFHYPTSPNYLRIVDEYRRVSDSELNIGHDHDQCEKSIKRFEEIHDDH